LLHFLELFFNLTMTLPYTCNRETEKSMENIKTTHGDLDWLDAFLGFPFRKSHKWIHIGYDSTIQINVLLRQNSNLHCLFVQIHNLNQLF